MLNKIKKRGTSKILNSLSKYGFPRFYLKAIEFENGTMEVEAIWMNKESHNNTNSKYVLKKDFLLHTKDFDVHVHDFKEHVHDFKEHVHDFKEHVQEFREFRTETNKRFDNLDIKIDKRFDELKNLIIMSSK